MKPIYQLIKVTPPLRDLLIAIELWRYVFYVSYLRIVIKNSGSKLGIVWEPLSTLLVSIVLSIVWSKVLNVEDPAQYFIYVYSGMVVWGLLSSIVTKLSSTLVRNNQNLITRRLSVYSYFFEDIISSFIPFMLSLPLLLVFSLMFGELSVFGVLFLVISCLLVCILSLMFSVSIGLIAYFLGDVRQLITSVMRLSFLVTPVIWQPTRLGQYEYLLMFNPFYPYIHMMRNSITGEAINPSYVYSGLLMCLFLSVLAYFMIKKFYYKIHAKALTL